MRLIRTLILLILTTGVALPFASCSKKSSGPVAPSPPPDKPDPPTLQYVPNFQTNSQEISFTPPDEDLVIEVVSVFFQHPGTGGIQVNTDFTPGQASSYGAHSHVTTVTAGLHPVRLQTINDGGGSGDSPLQVQ
jgi:hypothetical protein